MSVAKDPPIQSTVEDAIRRYCAAHPAAADTLDGVWHWWLVDITCTLKDVEQSLGALVAAGVLGKRTLASGAVVYSARAPEPDPPSHG